MIASVFKVHPAADVQTPSQVRMWARRLRFFCDLLVTGYRRATGATAQPRCLRTERIALGIDLPELDTVPLWSYRRNDGAVSIPFVEFLLAEIATAAERLSDEPLPSQGPEAAELSRLRDALLRALRPAGLDELPHQQLPRLTDVFVPDSTLARICGADGVLDRILPLCDSLVIGAEERAAAGKSREGHLVGWTA